MLSVVNVECALFRGGKYLVIQRSFDKKHAPGLLGFPGGKVELDDPPLNTLEACAKREVLEEVGLFLEEALEYVQSSSFFLPGRTFAINVLFFCRLPQAEYSIQKKKDELAGWSWMEEEELRSDSRTPPWLQNSLDQIRVKCLV